jgi:hypothetical protein
MGKRSREGKVQSPTHLQKTIVKNVLLVSKTTVEHFFLKKTNTVCIVFQKKYEVLHVFHHLIKDNKYGSNKINKQHRH